MANVTFIYPCYSDRGTVSTAGAAWRTPLAAMQDPRLSRVARSATAAPADTAFDVDLGEAQAVAGVALVRHNLSLGARWRVRISGVPDFATSFYDSGWQPAWNRVYPWGTVPWGSPNWWDGMLSERERRGYPSLSVMLQASATFGRYLRIEIDDHTNQDGYIEIGRLYVGDRWQPKFNASYGASLQWGTESSSDRAVDGSEYFDRREGLRSVTFELARVTREEAMARVLEMHRVLGVDQQLLFFLNPDDSENLLRTSFLGRLSKLNPITYPHFGANSTGYEIKEAR